MLCMFTAAVGGKLSIAVGAGFDNCIVYRLFAGMISIFGVHYDRVG